MALVRVWNDNVYPHEEKFKGKLLVIEPSQSIQMEDDDAHQFLSQFTKIVRRGDGTFDPRSFKKLRIERLEQKEVKLNPLFHHAVGKLASSREEFELWNRQYKHQMVDEAERAKVERAETDEKIAELKAENAELRKDIKDLMATFQQVMAAQKPKRKKKPLKTDGTMAPEDIEVTYQVTGTNA